MPGNRLPLTTVEARSLSEATFWNEFVCKHTPVILKGAASNWSALQRWHRIGYLEDLCEDETVEFRSTFHPVNLFRGAAQSARKLAEGTVRVSRQTAICLQECLDRLALPSCG
jgi:hypothetical protein